MAENNSFAQGRISDMRRLFRDVHAGSWSATIITSLAIFTAAAAMHFISSPARPFAQRAADALLFSASLFGVALVCGVLVWGVARLVRRDDALDMKDTVLWVAALVGVAYAAFVVLG